MQQMYQNNYTLWFYTYNRYVFPYTQVSKVSTGGNGSTFNEGDLSSLHNIMGALNPGLDARLRIDDLDEEQKNSSQAMKAITYATQIYIGLVNIDYKGGMAYLFTKNILATDISNFSLREGAGFAFFGESELEGLYMPEWSRAFLKKYYKGGTKNGDEFRRSIR